MHRMINKYTPKKLSSFEGRQESLLQLRQFAEQYSKGALMLHGPPGSGKTTAVYALANELDYEVLELNASDVRKKDVILNVVGSASKQMSLFNKGKIILIDDVDSISSRDRGATTAIASIIKDSKWPVIMTATDIAQDKIKDLRKKSELVNLRPFSYMEAFTVLKEICDNEKIPYDESSLKSLARQSGGDVRAAMTDLQVLMILHGSINNTDFLSPRNQKEELSNALMLVFKSMNAKNVLYAFDNTDVDFNQRFLWLDENLPREYSSVSLMKAYDALSRADVFNGRIRRQQHWRFLVYMNALLTAGISLSKDEKNPSAIIYKRSTRPLRYWLFNMRYAKKKAISEKIAPKLHVSKRNAFKHYLPLFSMLFKNNDCSGLADSFELNEEEVNWLRK